MSDPVRFCFQLWVDQGNSPLNLVAFKEEFAKFNQIAKLIRGFKTGKQVNLRLLVNHTIVLYNVFGVKITPLFFFHTSQELWPEMNSLLTFLKMIPEDQIILYSDKMLLLKNHPGNGEFSAALEESLK